MFQRNNIIWRKGLVCKSSRVASNQVIQRNRWYNKRILIKGYSVPQDFSWIKNYKLLLIANIVEDAVSGLRQFLTTENSWKIKKNINYFILTNWICYYQIKFCSYYAFSLNQMSDIHVVWKHWPLKLRSHWAINPDSIAKFAINQKLSQKLL